VFWKHWHISLSTWFRDYLYIPLGGNRLGKGRAMLNIFIVFLVSGFWHGANWTFIIWGIIHGLIYLFYILAGERKEDEGFTFSISNLFNILLTFSLVSLAFVFFRSPSIQDSMGYLSSIFVGKGESSFLLGNSRQMIMTIISLVGILILMTYEIVSKRKNLIEVKLSKYDLVFIGLCTLFLGAFKNHLDFVYFQF
jgi:D-alanyl-lipoteichoic acid acyltransferase DltB (MBOAT superfamily)